MMKRVIWLIAMVPCLVLAVPPAVSWYSTGLFEDSNGQSTIPSTDTILGNSFMTMVFDAGDPDGWSDVTSVKVRIWNTNAATNAGYNKDFAEFKYYPADAHWTCLGPALWDIENTYSSGPAATNTSTAAQRMYLVFKPSSQATATGAVKSWKIRVTVADGSSSTNIVMKCRLRQTASSSPSDGGVFSARPNPFKIERDGTMTFAYEPGFSEDCKVDLSILTIYGESVITLADAKQYLQGQAMGLDWDGKNGAKQPVASGIYTARLRVTYSESKRTESLLFNFAVFR
jgi:hypothetical protein